MFRSGKLPSYWLLAALLFAQILASASGQVRTDPPSPASPSIESLSLSSEEARQLDQAVKLRDYPRAEKLLLSEIDKDPHSPRSAQLLAYIGSIYFLDQDFLNAAVAWKKSQVIAPLNPSLRFSLAMAYIRIGHPDWGRSELKSLAMEHPADALYPYWLGRLDYDAQNYDGAIHYFQQALVLDPAMARAYDNLGLCYAYKNDSTHAIENYQKAIEADRKSPNPSPWPHLNLALSLQLLNRMDEAETQFREAIRLDPKLAPAHFRLGNLLEDRGRSDAAIPELKEAAHLDSSYAEPHFSLARIYRKAGQTSAADEEVQIYLSLHSDSGSPAPQSSKPK
ncbi:lipopolysaccharide assembly protein LapB [Acidobacterium sp. S8]|uniref:tetratricopeptide repeat protein n=1 Tax=Acidobacterium sp. S8 TaxID=1641854 RepID=UPI00131DCF2A|nr:tetratricopeptide repeat protein [Acidobacterium sp. S8]